jgi:hypothetical protein
MKRAKKNKEIYKHYFRFVKIMRKLTKNSLYGKFANVQR